MSLTTAPAATTPAPQPTAPPLRQRRPRWAIWLGVLLIALGAIAGAWLFTQGQSTRAVITVRSDLTAGQPIRATDLATTTVPAGSGLASVDAARLEDLVGSYATMSLPAGALLTDRATTKTLTPPPGQSIVGIGVKNGQLPARGLRGGDRVRVVVTSSPGTGQQAAQGPTAPGTTWSGSVVDAGPADPGGVSTVDVSIQASDAAAVAAAAGTGNIAIILDEQG